VNTYLRRLLARCHGSAPVAERDCESRTARRPAWPACRGDLGLPSQQAALEYRQLDGSVPDAEVLELIGHAYDLVVAHLTKAQRSKLIT